MSTKKHSNGPRLSVSTWSLHRTLGAPPGYGVEQGPDIPAGHGQGEVTLLELPAKLAAFGLHTLEICHFHLPSRDPGYLTELKASLAGAGVELFSLLVDRGDVTDPEHGLRDMAWIESWIEVGAALGTRCMRVIAGKQPPSDEVFQTSLTRLGQLAQKADAAGIRLMTENWFAMLPGPAQVRRLLESLEGQVGLCLDFGNWKGEEKYAGFEAIAPYAESCHAKAHFSPAGEIDRTDYTRCLEITAAANFKGPYTLIFDSPAPGEWAGLEIEKEIVASYL